MGGNTRYSKRVLPGWAKDVGALIDERARVDAICPRCGVNHDVALLRIARRKGRDFSLVDRHPPCKTPGCDGRVTFRARRWGANTWPLLLRDLW